jgi:hypothetical protein
MYFASDTCDIPHVASALTERIDQRPELTWIALVDSAFDYGSRRLMMPNPHCAVYDGEGLSALAAVSPLLIELPRNDVKRLQSDLKELLRHRKDRPMLSFIAADEAVPVVLGNLKRFANPLCADGQDLLLRFADTRVLIGLPQALSEMNWRGMTYQIVEWVLIDREGSLKCVDLPVSTKQGESFRLSDTEFASLVLNGEPDAIIETIAEGNPEALSGHQRASVYKKVFASCELAREYGVNSFPDLVALAYLSFLDGGKGLKDPNLLEKLRSGAWEKGRLIEELLEIVP